VFVLKKIITAFAIPPGIFILFLLVAGLFFLIKKRRKTALFNVSLALVIWMLSIFPVGYHFVKGIESGLTIPEHPKGDVIFVLYGPGYRMGSALSLYRKLNVPIVVLGVEDPEQNPSVVNRLERFFINNGVPPDHIIFENKSRDTIENARAAKEMSRNRDYKKPILITSAFHMKRALLSFEKANVSGFPLPKILSR